MFSDTVEETLTLRMGDLKVQLPRALADLSQSPPPQPLFSLKSELDIQDHGFDFYSSPFDNSFPYRGILNNERTFSSSPTASNTSFLSEASFTPVLKGSQHDSHSASENFGLLTTSSPYRGRNGNIENGSDVQHNLQCGSDVGGSFLPKGNQFNDSLTSSIGSVSSSSQKWDSPKTSNGTFDFPFPTPSESSLNSTGSSCADSPSRRRFSNGTTISNFANQWNTSDVSSLLDNTQSSESSSSSSVTTTSALGNSIWTPSQVSTNSSSSSSNGQQWDVSALDGLSIKQLIDFSELLKNKYDESFRDGEFATANKAQEVLVQVQQYIISSYVTDQATSPPANRMQSPPALLPSPMDNSLDKVAIMHRDIAGSRDAPFTWSGHLPPRIHRNPTYSCKVFLGGLPWDIMESTLIQTFKPFGILRIEWPGKDGNTAKPKGYAYAVFENEKQVKMLLQNCTHDYSCNKSGNFYYKISSKKYRGKDVQIIPWAQSDSNFVRCQASKIDSQKTIFVGALHGMVNAEGLATIMNDLFGGVVYAGIDTDRLKYPIGSARVTFSNHRSFMKAVTAAFVFIKTARFDKKLQVDPYLEDATCSQCNLQQGPYFCRDISCFCYFCRTCFQYKHAGEALRNHRPLTRTTSSKQQTGASPVHSALNIFRNWQPPQHGMHQGGNNGSNARQFGRTDYSNNNHNSNNNNNNNNNSNSLPFYPNKFNNQQQQQQQSGGSGGGCGAPFNNGFHAGGGGGGGYQQHQSQHHFQNRPFGHRGQQQYNMRW